MNPLLLTLLGQQAGSEIPVEDEYQGNIPVTGNRPTGNLPADMASVTTNNAEAVMNREQDVRESQEASKRRGMFGMKGTLRDVLGVVGDAFLIQSGRNPLYGPTRRQEQISDAGAGFSLGGDEARAAAERVGYYDMELGRDLLAEAQKAQLNQSGQEIERLRAETAKGKLNLDTVDAAMKRVSQIYAAAQASGDPRLLQAAEAAAAQISESTGIPLEQLLAGGDPALIAGREATSYQNLRMPMDQEKIEIQRGNLEARLRGVQNAEARTRIAEQTLGLKRDDQRFGRLMDMFGISLKTEKIQDDRKPSGPRQVPTTPAASRFHPAPN